MAASFSLIIEDDAGKQIVVPFARDVITIGRKEGNTIRLTERNVSRFHAKLSRENGHVHVEDLKSFNGVKLNGDRIAGRVQVAAGDVIEIGDYHLELRSNAAAQTAKLGPSHKSAGVADAPAESDEFEGDTQRWEPPPAAAKIPIGGIPTTELAPVASPFGEGSGDTERMALSQTPLSAQQSWPPPAARAPMPSLTMADMEPTARQPIANVPIGGLAPPPPMAPMAPLPAPPPAAPAFAPVLAPLDESTQDMPLPAAQAFARGHQGHKAPALTEQLRLSPANPADDVSLPRLVVLNTIFSGSTFPLRAAENVLGRTDDNDIVLEHKSVSRNHAKLVREGERVRILDLKSANGVLVNGQEVEQHVLRSGDVIELGRVRIRFVPTGERFAVSPDEIEKARLADAANDFEEGSQTVNVTNPLRAPQAAPATAAAPKPVVLYAIVGVLAVVVIILLIVVLSRGGGQTAEGDRPPDAAPTVVTAAAIPPAQAPVARQ